MNSFHKVVAKAIEASKSPEDISLQETEEKFSSLVLAFKTDRQTLDKRKDLHLRARDIAEQNIQKELEGLKDGMKTLNQICNNSSNQQTFTRVQHHVEVLEQSIARMSSRAEVHGAVQQELRVSQAIDVMVHHVENLKKVYDKEHAELIEARKMIRTGRQDSRESGGGEGGATRAGNMPGLPQFRANRRRASIAVISKNPLPLRNSLSSVKSNDHPTRLFQRNNSFISSPLFLEEENEDAEAPTNPRAFVRRKSSSILDDLSTDFVSQLQNASSLSRREEEADEDEEEKEKDEEREDRDLDEEWSSDSAVNDAVLMNLDKRELEAEEPIEIDSRNGSNVLRNSMSLKRMLNQKQSSRSTLVTSRLEKWKEKIRQAWKCLSGAHFRGASSRFLFLAAIFLLAFLIIFIALLFGGLRLFFRNIFSGSN